MTKENQRSNREIDLDQTIQFTKEDLKKIRQKNKQPEDADYFSSQSHSAEIPKGDQSQIEIDEEDFYEKHDDIVVERTETQREVKVTEDNPFVYHSKTEELRAMHEIEKQKKAQQTQERKDKIKNLLTGTTELEVPDQVETDFKDDQVQQRMSRRQNNQKKRFEKNGHKSNWLDKWQEKIKSLFQRNEITSEVEDELVLTQDEQNEFEEYNGLIENELLSTEELDEIENANSLNNAQSPLETVSDEKEEGNSFSETLHGLGNSIKQTMHQLTQQNSQIDYQEAEDKLETLSGDNNEGVSESLVADGMLEDVMLTSDIPVESLTDDQEQFTKGTLWLTIGSVVSRVLGALYVIPWATWFGAEYTTANVLYSTGYRPYTLFLAISTAGFPSAVAKQMSHYHAQKEYKVADRLFKNTLLIMLASGILSAGLLFLLAPTIAYNSSTDNPQAAIIVIRSLAPALLILPLMSLLRGYFQGFGDMVPTAISQIIEQIARVIYLLTATYAIMKVLSGNVTTAVAHSTFAAFVGAAFSLIYLMWVYWRQLPLIRQLKEQSVDAVSISTGESFKLLVKDSIPFILLGSGITLAQIIDQFSFRQILESTSVLLLSEIRVIYGAMSLDVDKLMMIIISVAIGMSLSSIPLITKLYASNQIENASRLIEHIIVIFLVVMLPAAFGLASISDNVYRLFYAQGYENGPQLLVTGAYLSIVLGAYSVLSTILQSFNYRRKAMKYLMIGIGVKLMLQVPFVAFWHGHGALLATLFAFLVTSILMFWQISKVVHIHFDVIMSDIVVIGIATVVMAISVHFWNETLNILFGDISRGVLLLKILLEVTIGGFIYCSILGLFGKLNLLIGSRMSGLQEKMRLF